MSAVPTKDPRLVVIKVKGVNHDFMYDPALLNANPGDTITWQCAEGPFTVSFPEGSPFGVVDIASSATATGGLWIASTDGVILNVTPRRVYHYHVAVSVKGEVFMDSGCPGVKV